ncbi:hypothetical protein [Gilliamella sp. Fer1-1]|uniref:hypothetical protein n=1 Tax=Gilliamella sp. Fer1-1 TaxID=3120240 RepID=UPI00159EC19F|nr:hypothetical protein [Gilliamella apicola]
MVAQDNFLSGTDKEKIKDAILESISKIDANSYRFSFEELALRVCKAISAVNSYPDDQS